MNRPNELDDSSKKEQKMRTFFSIRINLFFFVTFVLFSVLIVRLAYLQFVEGPTLKAAEFKQNYRPITIPPIRGNIYDAAGAPIAWTRSTQSLFYQIMPGQKTPDQVKLAQDLEMVFAKYGNSQLPQPKAADIFAAMDTGYEMDGSKSKKAQSYSYMPRRLKADLTKEEIAYIAEHRDELPGIDVSEESTRVYDSDRVAVQTVGYLRPFKGVINSTATSYLSIYKDKVDEYLNEEYVGKDGIEFLYQDELRGKNGTKTYPVNALDQITGQVQITPPEKGHNLVLTMNREVQLAAQRAITENLETMRKSSDYYVSQGKKAQAGYAVAMEVDTGRIMAMASMPDYDPSVWNGTVSQAVMDQIQFQYPNGTITDRPPNIQDDKERGKHPTSMVPLGSTQKPLTVLLGLNEKLFSPWDHYYDTGILRYGKDNLAKISNSDGHAYGDMTPARAIQVSSNTFMAEKVGLALYNTKQNPLDIWDSYMKKFGLGVKTGSGLPMENDGVLDYKNTKTSSTQNALVMASFGQQAKYTTLQLAQYTAMLANHGKRMKPQFVKEIKTYDGKTIEQIEPEILNTETFPETYWNVLRDGMKSDVSGFDGVTYSFNRKTGTSESDIAGKKVDNAVFIAYAPVENPKLAVAVVVPEGGFGRYGAAPIARKIFDAYDQYFGLDGVPKGVPQTDGQGPGGTAGQ